MNENKFCFCTLAYGKNYRDLAKCLSRNLEEKLPNTPLVILTDKPKDYSDCKNVIPFKHHAQTVGIYNDKRFVIAKALELFPTCIYIDSDGRWLKGRPLSSNQDGGIITYSHEDLIKHIEEFHPEMTDFFIKIANKLGIDLKNAKYIQEYLFAVQRDNEKEKAFLKYWGIIANYFELRNFYHEGGIIGLAAAKANLKVTFGRGSFFDEDCFYILGQWQDKIVGENENAPKEMVDIYKNIMVSKYQKTGFFRKIVKKIFFFYRYVRLCLITLRDFNFYYR